MTSARTGARSTRAARGLGWVTWRATRSPVVMRSSTIRKPIRPSLGALYRGTPAVRDPQRNAQEILFVLHTGIGWEDLPQELGFGSGMTCWRRLQRWTDAGVFDQLHQILLAKRNAANRIDWSRAAMDGSPIDAKGCPNRPIADQPRQARLQASPDRRRNGTPI